MRVSVNSRLGLFRPQNLLAMSEEIGKESHKLPRRPSFRNLHFKSDSGSNKKLQISFGGCGFLGVYHVGVGKCVVDHAPHLFSEFDCFYGASAGAITAVCAACRSDPMIPYKWVRKTFEDSRKYWFGMYNPFFDLYGRLRIFLDGYLPENAHKMCRDIVKISLTTIGDNGLPQNWLVSDFRTRQELINIILASSFIPGYAGFKDFPKIRGKRCFDGGFTSNIPCVSDPDVITVTPFAGFCDICPRGESCTQHMINICDQPMLLSSANLYRLAKSLCPTSWKELEDLYHLGYDDCLSFFRKEGLIPDPKIHKRESSSLSSPPSDACFFTVPSTMSCDFPGNSSSNSYSTMTSLTLSATGEFFSCSEGSERSSFASIPLDAVERGLDLKGTEKATHLVRKFGREEEWSVVNQVRSEGEQEGEGEGKTPGVVSRIVSQPVKMVKLSWSGLSWMLCNLHEVIPHRFSQQWPLSKLAENKADHAASVDLQEDLASPEGFLGSLPSSSLLIF